MSKHGRTNLKISFFTEKRVENISTSGKLKINLNAGYEIFFSYDTSE